MFTTTDPAPDDTDTFRLDGRPRAATGILLSTVAGLTIWASFLVAVARIT